MYNGGTAGRSSTRKCSIENVNVQQRYCWQVVHKKVLPESALECLADLGMHISME